VRRIEAVSGKAAEDYVNEYFTALQEIKNYLKNPKDVKKAVENLQLENANLKKKLESFETRQLSFIKADLVKKVEEVNGIEFIGQIVEISTGDSLKRLCLDLKQELQKNYVVVLAGKADGKAYVAILIEEEIAASRNFDATKIIKEQVAPLIKGGGGGQKTLATAGGQDAGNLALVIERVKGLL
jgi:alanyl-tRNA synthetase